VLFSNNLYFNNLREG